MIFYLSLGIEFAVLLQQYFRHVHVTVFGCHVKRRKAVFRGRLYGRVVVHQNRCNLMQKNTVIKSINSLFFGFSWSVLMITEIGQFF